MTCNNREKTIGLLKRASVYIKQIHDDAEADHDRDGDRFSYETMIDTELLLSEIAGFLDEADRQIHRYTDRGDG